MATQPSLWWWSAKKYWATQIDGKRLCLAKGRKNKQLAQEKLDALLAERKLLASVDGPLTVAALCEEFLDDVQRHLAPKTYDSYRYGCQMFVDMYGALAAHTIKPLHVRHFTIALEKRLNSTTQGIVLRSVQRCFNWGVEEQIIPPHSLGRIRKPTSVRRDRYLTDKEFQAMLRATNPKNNHRRGAASPVIDLLAKHPDAGVPVLHWFSGNASDLERAKSQGIWFSVGPAMLSSKKGREIAAKLPYDRVVTETDAPFAQLEGEPLMPWMSELATKTLADVWELDVHQVRQQVLANFDRLVRQVKDAPR